VNQVTSITTGALTATPVSPYVKYTNFSPRASLRFEVSPRTNVYGSITRGFRSGILQVVNTTSGPVTPPVRPEKITAYEIGFKTAGRRMRFDTAAWYYDYRDLQVGLTLANPLCSTCGPINVTSNASKAEVYGVEAQATLLLVRNLDIDLGAAYVHGEYTDFANATGVGLNTTTNLNVSGQVQDWTGHQMARAPSFSGSAGLQYTIEDVVGGRAKASVNYKYTASYVLNNPSLYGPLAGAALANEQRFRQPAYSLVNGSLYWTDASDHFRVGIWANNIFDKKYRLSRNGSTFGEYAVWAMPRQVGVSAGYNF
jgi:iron complex outermembrane receptor protein